MSVVLLFVWPGRVFVLVTIPKPVGMIKSQRILSKEWKKTDQNSLRVWLMPSQTITSIKEISVLVRPDGLVVWRITVTLESSPSNQIMACPPIPRQACHGARLVQENQSQCIEVKKPALASLWNSFCDL